MLGHHFLEYSTDRHENKTALIAGSKHLTFRELNETADHLARFLLNIGVKRQDRIVICLENTDEAVAAIFGVLKASAVLVFLNPTIKSPKLNYILRGSGAVVLITHSDKHTIVSQAVEGTELGHIIWCGADIPADNIEGASMSSHSWQDALNEIISCRLPRSIDVDMATIIYTSGSTEEPKEIENMLCSLGGVSEAAVIGVPDDIFGQAIAIKAFIVAGYTTTLSTDDVMRFCTKHLESFLLPKYIEFIPNIPMATSGKIDKKALKML